MGLSVRGVGEDHDGGLQTLGPVNGHHPHLAAGSVHVAFDLDIAGVHPREETGQCGQGAAFVKQCLRQQFVNCLGALRAKPRDQFFPPALYREDCFQQFEGTVEIHTIPQALQG